MKRLISACLLPLIIGVGSVKADDIDIYLQNKPGSVPLAMLMLDWRPSVFAAHCNAFNAACAATMSPGAAAALEAARVAAGTPLSDKVSRYEVFVAILESIMSTADFDPIHMGLMISNFDNGGTILQGYNQLGAELSTTGITPLPSGMTGTDQYKKYLIYRLRQITAPDPFNNSKSHKLQPSETFYEMFSYWNGKQVRFGNVSGTANNFQSITPPSPAFDPLIQSGGNYVPPAVFASASCTKLYAIAMAMSVANQDDDLDTPIGVDMQHDSASTKFADMLKYMNHHDLVAGAAGSQELITWIISDSGSLGSTPAWAAAGNSGDGVLNFEDAVALEAKLREAFVKIISVSSTFVAASVPVNVFNRIEALDNLFVALFEAQATIDWPGNLKRLRLNDSDGDTIFDQFLDVNGVPAFEEIGKDKGRLRVGALTYWTDPTSLPPPDASKAEVAERDGRSVARGGAGQIIPGYVSGGPGNLNSDTGARQLFVGPTSGTALTPFNANAVTVSALQTELGAATAAIAESHIKWARGQDVDNVDSDSGPTSLTEARPWILGSSIHSRPLAVNYGATPGYTNTNPNIRLMMGTNDGFFHIIENSTTGAAASGKELFAFMPRELLGNVSQLRSNTRSSTKMLYGVDGTPVPFQVDIDRDGTIEPGDGDEVYVYFGLRRGGKGYYALNVTNPAITPSLAWKITNTDANFTELGLTFSDSIVGKVRYGATATDVVIFAGGYNGGWDAGLTGRVGKDLNAADDTIGNAIYIVDARTGALIWKAKQGATSAVSNTVYQHADMVDSIPGSVTPVDINGNGIIDRLYVGDTGGAVWRVDLPEGSGANHRRDNWFVSRFAELGTDGLTTDRRFFHGPEVVLTFDSSGDYDGVLISSGDRPHPLETDVQNYLFLIKDRATTSGDVAVKARSPLLIGDLPDVSACVVSDATNPACTVDKANGWKIALATTGEKALSTPLVASGVAFFTSYAPTTAASACDVTEGEGAIYLVNLADGSAFPVDDDLPQRKHILGDGIPAGVTPDGSGGYIIPGGGIGLDSDGDGIEDGSIPIINFGGILPDPIYWREPSVDSIE